MQLFKIAINRDSSIYQLGDVHWGTIFHHENGFERALDTIEKDKNAIVVMPGDLVEAITVDDPRYDASTNKEPVPFIQAQEMVKKLWRIREKIKVIGKGNHESRLLKYLNIPAYIANELGCHYGTWSFKIQFVDNKDKDIFKGYFFHGDERKSILQSNAGDPIQRQANEKAMLKRLMFYKAGDCHYMGCQHYHKLIVVPPTQELYLTDNGKEIHQEYTVHTEGLSFIHPDLRWYGCGGSFYKQFIVGHDSYAETHGYKPTELGYLKLHVDDTLKYVESVKV